MILIGSYSRCQQTHSFRCVTYEPATLFAIIWTPGDFRSRSRTEDGNDRISSVKHELVRRVGTHCVCHALKIRLFSFQLVNKLNDTRLLRSDFITKSPSYVHRVHTFSVRVDYPAASILYTICRSLMSDGFMLVLWLSNEQWHCYSVHTMNFIELRSSRRYRAVSHCSLLALALDSGIWNQKQRGVLRFLQVA